MKKILTIIFALFAFAVQADNVITSKEYVDTQASNLQEQISANDANTVLTYTDTAGTVGEKKIYDSSAAYSGQNDALVTAGAFNTAIQNALETEFVCIDWLGDVHDNAHCLLYEIRGARKNILDPAIIRQGTLSSTEGYFQYKPNRCYFCYIPVKAGDIMNFTVRTGTPPVYGRMVLYSEPDFNHYTRYLSGDPITIGDHTGYQFRVSNDGYICGLFVQDENFTPDDIVEPMLEISTTPSSYEPYTVYLPQGN